MELFVKIKYVMLDIAEQILIILILSEGFTLLGTQSGRFYYVLNFKSKVDFFP